MSSAARITRPPARKPQVVSAFGRPIRRFTVEQYHSLGARGILTENDNCELIRGIVLEKPVIKPPHKKALRRLLDHVPPVFGTSFVIDSQGPITLSDSEPEPDLSVAVGPEKRYDQRNPGPDEIVLVVEIFDSTLDYDRREKLELYAGSKIPVYWIVNLIDRRVEVYTEPRGGKNPTYRKHTDYAPDDDVPVTVGRKRLGTVAASALLP
jgi:Uma2 family endonuclease